MKLNLLNYSNFTYADADGNILYFWNAQLPKRLDDGTNYDLDVPAETGKSVWQWLHPNQRRQTLPARRRDDLCDHRQMQILALAANAKSVRDGNRLCGHLFLAALRPSGKADFRQLFQRLYERDGKIPRRVATAEMNLFSGLP